MKRLLPIAAFILLVCTACEFDTTCISCEIYDSNDDYVKDFGEYCSDYNDDLDLYEEEADYHADLFYGGYAVCDKY